MRGYLVLTLTVPETLTLMPELFLPLLGAGCATGAGAAGVGAGAGAGVGAASFVFGSGLGFGLGGAFFSTICGFSIFGSGVGGSVPQG